MTTSGKSAGSTKRCAPARADMAVEVLLRWRNDVYFADVRQ